MKSNYKILIIISFLFITLSNTYFNHAHGQPLEAKEAMNELKSNIKFFTLSNGIRVILLKRGIAPVFAGSVIVKVGGVDESYEKTGISHLLEHMAFKGTKEIGTKDYAKESALLQQLEELARKEAKGGLNEQEKKQWNDIQQDLETIIENEQFSRLYEEKGAVGLNATTSSELTEYFVELPKSAFHFFCAIESSRLINPVMRQFYSERNVVMEERSMRYDDKPEGRLWELLLTTAFHIHPYRNPVIGYRDDISKLTATDVEEFRSKFYVPSNIVVSIVGDVNVDLDLPIIEKYFGKVPSRAAPTKVNIIEPKQNGERIVTLKERSSPRMLVAYQKPNYPNPNDAPISLMLETLAGSATSPLYKSLIRDKGVAVLVSVTEGPGMAYPNLAIFTLIPKTPYTNKELLMAFDEEIEKFKNKFASQQDAEQRINIAKKAVAMDYLNGFNSNLSLALTLGSSEIIYNRWEAAFDWYQEAMAVTLEKISKVANEYLNNDYRTIAFLEQKN